jgi:putative protease
MKDNKTSELLLPVGNYQMCLAAIHNGANAIYVGMPGFNARGRSHDHSMEELQEIIETCHLYGVKVHVAFNILIFQNELQDALKWLDQVMLLGPDAFIVQDIGLIQLIKNRYPSMEVHGSTQMTVTNHDAIELLQDLDIKRFVLGRENSLKDIQTIRENTTKELEVFVHGALCVAYSGQCFTSEALGGRSANRGQCAQSCRFEYDLYVDGEKKDLNGLQYLLSPQDLCGLGEVEQLQDMGIESFKVEGRLKSPQFVASVANSYRQALDKKLIDINASKSQMATTFSRGFYSGWLHGVAHQELVDGSFGTHRGVLLGEWEQVNNKVLLKSNHPLHKGDGVLFAGNKREDDVGAKIYQVETSKQGQLITFPREFDLNKIDITTKAYLNSSNSLEKSLSKTYTDRHQYKRIPLQMIVKLKNGEPLKLEVSDGDNQIQLMSDAILEKAIGNGIDEKQLIKNLAGLSQTAYELEKLKVLGDKLVFIHPRELKKLKRDVVAKLNEIRTKIKLHSKVDLNQENTFTNTCKDSSKLSILIRKLEQLQDLKQLLSEKPELQKNASRVILDYEFGKDYRPSVEILNELNIDSVIATTRILKPGEYNNLKMIERAKPTGILVRNLGALNYFKESTFKLYGDFSLNISNSLTANYLLDKGLTSICPSYDLNKQQLDELLTGVDASKMEVTIHQYMPEFHMEHCVFAAFLSKGNSFRDCGKPCEKHQVELKDMYGNIHQIKADQECRNTMFRATPQSAAQMVEQWKKQGVEYFRFEALHETGDILKKKMEVYLLLMSGELTANEVFEKIGVIETYGVSTGQLLNKKTYKNRKKSNMLL